MTGLGNQRACPAPLDAEPMKMPDVKYARTFPRAGRLVRIMFLSVFMWASVFAFPYVVYRMFFEPDPEIQRTWALAALGCLVCGAGSRFLIYVIGSKIRCPLCQGASFQTARCRMNENARRYPPLTYSTTMVIDMFIYRRFVCKYCGTPFRLRK